MRRRAEYGTPAYPQDARIDAGSGKASWIVMRHSVSRKIRAGLALVLNAGFPWTMPIAANTPDAAARIRRSARPLLVRAFPPLLRPAAAIAMTLVWPVWSFHLTRMMVASLPPGAFPGWSRGALFRASWWAALRHNTPPLEFFAYRMPDAPEISPSAWFVQTEVPRIAVSLAAPEAVDVATDKHLFGLFCRESGLPGIPTAALSGQTIAAPRPAAETLVLKPRRGSNGRDIEFWQVQGRAYRRQDPAAMDCRVLDWPGLCAHAKARHDTEGEEFLLQPCLRLHPSLREIAGDGIPAARMVTGLSPAGEVTLISASFARPAAGRIISNGGPHRTVDLDSGRLDPPRAGQYRSIFPDADLARYLDGLVLPDWPCACEIVLAAHRAFPARAVLLGWDVAFTDDGPVLIEANLGVSLFIDQTDSLVPAGTTPVADLIAAWI